MKAKKFIALAMSVAMAVGTASLFAACKTDDGGEGGGGGEGGSDYAVDTRIWYAVGKDTKGTLKDQGWNQNDSTYAFTRDTTVTDENVFTLSLDIYAGNVASGYSFKFLYKESAEETNVPWTRQVGMHAFAGMDGYEGEDLDQIIKIDGETVFTTAQDNGDNGNNIACAKGQDGTYKFTLRTKNATDTPKLSVERTAKIDVPYDMYIRGDMNNFNPQTKTMIAMTETIGSGDVHTTWSADLSVTAKDLWRTADGTEITETENDLPVGGTHTAIQLYNDIDKLTYLTADEDTTYTKAEVSVGNKSYGKSLLLPEGDYTITFDTTTKGVTIVKYAHKMYFSGEFNQNKPTASDMLTKGNDSWTGYLTIDADATDPEKTTAVSLYDSVTKSNTEELNLKAGTYAFKYTESTEKVEYEQVAYWLVGSFVDSRTNQNVNFAISEGITPKFEAAQEAGTYTATVKAEDVTTRDGYSWIAGDAGNTENGVFAIQVVYGTALLGVKDWNSSGANQYLPEGVWEVTFAGGPVTWKEGDEANVPTPPALAYEMYLTGSFNSWAKGDADYALSYNSGKGAWVGYLNVTADNTELKLYNKTSDTHYSTADLGEGNITLDKGYYMFVFLQDGNEVKYAPVDVYLIGSFFNADGTQLNFDVVDGITPKFEVGANANEISVTYDVTDVTAVAENAYDFSTWGDDAQGAKFVWKPIATCSLAEYSGNSAGTKMWDVIQSGNNYLKEVGNYTFTYNLETKAMSATLNDSPAEENPAA